MARSPTGPAAVEIADNAGGKDVLWEATGPWVVREELLMHRSAARPRAERIAAGEAYDSDWWSESRTE
ncbi:hypothetical protein ACU635_35185 [[Actinomadura] parvosata]|uniref:hypothetical protein n=1 Tax=[Actinomadura] parvosata TaxID=1955412 RepID=UPI00406C9A8D